MRAVVTAAETVAPKAGQSAANWAALKVEWTVVKKADWMVDVMVV
jgi:hypothetical protein